MVTRNVVLTDTQADMLDRLVAGGRYQNVSEAMRAGLRLLEREEAEMASLKARLDESIAQADAGWFAEGTVEAVINRAFAEGLQRNNARKGS